MEKYIRAEMQVTEFLVEDVITASEELMEDPVLGPDDTEIL